MDVLRNRAKQARGIYATKNVFASIKMTAVIFINEINLKE